MRSRTDVSVPNCIPYKSFAYKMLIVMALFALIFAFSWQASAISTAFTYQGRLTNGGSPANGTYDFEFKLYDSDSGGTQIGSTVAIDDEFVANGLFMVDLDFGTGYFNGDDRWLEIGVREGSSTGLFMTLSPRQKINPTPYAILAENSDGLNLPYDGTVDSATNPAFSITNTTGNIAIRGLATNAGSGTTYGGYFESYSTDGRAVTGATNGANARSVYGYAAGTDGVGVYGESANSDGVVGSSGTAVKSGVFGFNTASGGYGVTGRNWNGFGVYAVGDDTTTSDFVGDLRLAGDWGEIFAIDSNHSALDLYANGGMSINLDYDNDSTNTTFYIRKDDWTTLLMLNENGDLWVAGQLQAAGGKPAIVNTRNYGMRKIYAMESPELWFEDFGKASLIDGKVTINFDPIFSETVNLQKDYHVFMTPLSDDPVLLSVKSKTAKGFTVLGVTLDGQPAECSFDYRIVAKRLGYEDVRLDEANVPMQIKK